jgi:hypothetical protein
VLQPLRQGSRQDQQHRGEVRATHRAERVEEAGEWRGGADEEGAELGGGPDEGAEEAAHGGGGDDLVWSCEWVVVWWCGWGGGG